MYTTIGSIKEYDWTFQIFYYNQLIFELVFLCIKPHVSRLKSKEMMVFMVNIIKQEVVIEKTFKEVRTIEALTPNLKI